MSNLLYITEIKKILINAKKLAYSSINTAMVEAYWLIGKQIVEEEQKGNDRANYGSEILKTLSSELTKEFGRGFSLTNLKNFRKFYLTFNSNDKSQTVSDQLNSINSHFGKLSWSHYERLIRIDKQEIRNYYLTEAITNNWSIRVLDRNISTLYYQRTISNQKKIIENKNIEINFNDEFIRNPTVLEFLNIPSNKSYSESQFEQALIDNIQNFLLELGKGFSFVARQKHIRTETTDFFIDLVFYNYILKCFVLIELKTNKLTHQDIGQLDMYVRMFDDLERTESDNPTIGILLCTETDKTIAKYSILSESKQIFANKYLPYLPSEEELIEEIEREKTVLKEIINKEDRFK